VIVGPHNDNIFPIVLDTVNITLIKGTPFKISVSAISLLTRSSHVNNNKKNVIACSCQDPTFASLAGPCPSLLFLLSTKLKQWLHVWGQG